VIPSQGLDKKGGVYGTPKDFLQAVDEIYPIWFDLAANAENCVFHKIRWWPQYGDDQKYHYDLSDDTLSIKNWFIDAGRYGFKGNGWMWLNPPFSNIEPWAKKCAEEGALGARVLFLVPQGTQAWARKWCRPNALEIRLEGRMTFDGETAPYPKDLTLWVFGIGMVGTITWQWGRKL
jgi:hypothetical protein